MGEKGRKRVCVIVVTRYPSTGAEGQSAGPRNLQGPPQLPGVLEHGPPFHFAVARSAAASAAATDDVTPRRRRRRTTMVAAKAVEAKQQCLNYHIVTLQQEIDD